MTTYTIRPYQAGDETAINDGFNAVFGAQRSLDEWRWKFQPESGGSWIVVAFDEDNQIIAHFAAVKQQIKYGDVIYTVGQAVDLYRIRRPSTQKERVFVETGRAFFEEYTNVHHIPFILGFPGEHSQLVGENHLNYAPGVRVYKWVKPVPRRWLNFGKPIPVTPPDLVDVDSLWQRTALRHPIARVRDGAALMRRYLTHPTRQYQYIAVTDDGRLSALGIVTSSRDALVLADLIWDGVSARALRRLEKQVVSLAQSQNCQRLEMWLSGDSQAEGVFREVGWSVSEDVSQQPYLSAISWHPDLSTDNFTKQVYLTLGDSDLI